MRTFLLLTGSILTLNACAYVTETQLQPLTVVTPGAHDAVCYVFTNDIKYKLRPPETININKDSEDLVVDCKAPGNRDKKVVIEPSISDRAIYGNLPTGFIPGAAFDYTSGAFFKYPQIVSVDFTSMAVRPEDLPAHNNPDIRQPETYDLEEFLPTQPRLNADKYETAVELRRRVRGGQYNSESGIQADNYAPGKGSLRTVIDATPEQLNPAGDRPLPADSGEGEGAAGEPIPLFPGQ